MEEEKCKLVALEPDGQLIMAHCTTCFLQAMWRAVRIQSQAPGQSLLQSYLSSSMESGGI